MRGLQGPRVHLLWHNVVQSVKLIISLSALLVATPCLARTLVVPGEFVTIQSAIDNSLNGDTILVSPGTYEEALAVQARSIALFGTSVIDTAASSGVIIDPSNLPNSNALACLEIFGGDSVSLRNLWFQNHEAMYDGREVDDPAGIDNSHGLQTLKLSNCRFDSVYGGIRGGTFIKVDSVVVFNSQRFCILRGDSTRITASYCRFHGAMTGVAVSAWTGSTFEKCSFTNTLNGWLLAAGKDSLLIENCDFGPFTSACGPAVHVRAGNATVIQDNVFHDMNIGDAVLAINQFTCSTTVAPNATFPVIRRNRFINIGPGQCQAGVALKFYCNGSEPGVLGTIVENEFVNVTSLGYFGSAINIWEGEAIIEDNRFYLVEPENTGAIYSRHVQPPETLRLRNNTFDRLDFAVEHETGQEVTDARENWWGDSSGPFNAWMNPDGQGAEVSNGVMFDPWLISPPDSSDTNSVAVEIELPLMPQVYRLTAFPNPFNSTTNLQIEVDSPGDYQVGLFDLTGRTVRELFAGNLNRSQTLMIETDGLPSGLYFARLTKGSRTLAATKLLLLK